MFDKSVGVDGPISVEETRTTADIVVMISRLGRVRVVVRFVTRRYWEMRLDKFYR